MKNMLILIVGLGLTCLIAASVLATANFYTVEPIRKAEAQQRRKDLSKILPAFKNDPTAKSEILRVPIKGRGGKDGAEVTFYRARDAAESGRIIGIAGEAISEKGFGGAVKVLVGLKPDGTILNVLVTSHSETPGLGTKVTDRTRTRYIWQAFSRTKASGLPPSTYLDQYDGRQAKDIGSSGFHVVRNKAELTDDTVLAVSGATISSRAVADAVNMICSAFESHKAELLK